MLISVAAAISTEPSIASLRVARSFVHHHKRTENRVKRMPKGAFCAFAMTQRIAQRDHSAIWRGDTCFELQIAILSADSNRKKMHEAGSA